MSAIIPIFRREQLLKFGDNIIFTANEHNVILDYQTDMPVYETTVKTAEDNHLHYLVIKFIHNN